MVGAGLVILIPVSPKTIVDYKPASLSGTALLAPFMTKRLVHITDLEDLKLLLTTQDPFFSSFTEEAQKNIDAIGGLSLAISLLTLSEFGPCVFSFHAFGHKMYSPGWKGHVSCKLLTSQKEKSLIVTGTDIVQG